jgi:hypothetical protein
MPRGVAGRPILATLEHNDMLWSPFGKDKRPAAAVRAGNLSQFGRLPSASLVKAAPQVHLFGTTQANR